jgi:hypothetical protein
LGGLQAPRNAATRTPEALANAAKFTAVPALLAMLCPGFNDAINRLISRDYFFIGRFGMWPLQTGHAWNQLIGIQNLTVSICRREKAVR